MANQITINIGAAANDGTGDPLRTAFNDVNLNFANVWNTGLPNSNVQFSDNRILTVNTNANLVLAPNGIGIVQSNVDIIPSINRGQSLGSTSKKWNTVNAYYMNADVANVGSFGNLTVSVANLHISGGSNGYVLQTDGDGNLTWTAQTGGGGNGTPGGANGQIQFNDTGSFGGQSGFGFDKITGNVSIPGTILTTANLESDIGSYSFRWRNFYINNVIATNRVTGTDVVATNVTATDVTAIQNLSAGNATVGNITSTHDIFANTGTFYGDQYSDGAIFIGNPVGTVLGSDVVMQVTANAGNYSQINFQNISNTMAASGDYIITADNGDDSTHFIDLGMTGSAWNGTQQNSLGDLLGPNNGYLYVQDGNLTIGTKVGNATGKVWNFDINGNLTLPGNTFAVNYANGSPVTLGGDTGQIGFDQYNIYNTTGGGIVISNFNYVTAEAETAYVNIPAGNSPGDLQIVQEQGNVTINANSRAVWSFNADSTLRLPNNGNITIVDNVITEINAVATANSAIGLRAFDNNGNTMASSFFDGADGSLNFYSYNPAIDTSYNWRFDNGGSFTLPNAPGNVYFGQEANQPVIIPYNTGLVINADRGDTAQDYLSVSQDGIELFSVHTINIDNSTTGLTNSDINLLSGDDIKLQGRNKADDTELEGGDINIWAGQGANSTQTGFDTNGGGDIQIYAGAGGIAQGASTFGGSGGYVEILGGDGGTSLDFGVGSGGDITLLAGSAGTPADTANGGYGGSVNISAGTTTRINESGGSISLNTGGSSGDGYGAAGAVEINIPASNVGPGGSWYFTGTGRALEVPADSEIFGPNFGNFTVGCAGNTIVTSSDYGANVKNWVFGYTGNLLAPGNIITPDNFVGPSLRTNLSNFNWSARITNMTQGASTVIVLANNIFGDPWDGQITITDVAGATEANGTWWYRATDSNALELFTDNTFTTPVDSSAWGTYTGGGVAVTIDYGNIQINAQTVTIQSGQADYNNRVWEFNSKGQTVLPVLSTARGDVSGGTITGYTLNIGDGGREAIITTPDAGTGEYSSQRLVINPGKGENGTAGEGGDIYLWAGRGGDNNGNGGDVKIRGGYGPGNGQGGYIRMEGGEVQGTGTAGFIELLGGTAGGAAGGYISLTGGPGATVGGNISIQGGYGSGDVGGNVVIQGGGSGQGLASYGNVNIVAGASTWTFNNTGNLVVPGDKTITSQDAPAGGGGYNVNLRAGASDANTWNSNPGGELNLYGGYGSFADGGGGPGGNVNIYSGASSDTHPGNITLNTGTNAWTFDYTGTLTLPQFYVGPGPSEQLTVHGTRQTVGTIGNSSAQLSGHTDFGSAVWTASSSIVQSARITFVVQSNGTAFNWEQFDVAVTKFDSANAIVSVSNRIRSNSAIPYTEVTAYVNEGSILEVWFNQPTEQNIGYINYQAVEFNLMAD